MRTTTLDTATAHREVLWNVSSFADQLIFYSLFAASLFICLWGLWSKVRLWMRGKPDADRFGFWWIRFLELVRFVFLNRGVNRERQVGVFHSLVFWGFLVLLFTTTMVFIDNDLGIKIYHGEFYLGVTVFSDLFGLGLFVGILLAYHRRYIQKPDSLHNTRSDILMLLLLAFLVLQGFGLEGLRIRATQDPWSYYSPIGHLFSLFFWSFSSLSLKAAHYSLWWIHSLSVFTFIALVQLGAS